MLNAETLYETLEAKRRELGFTQAEVGLRAFGKADTSAIQGIRRGAMPSAERLEKLCAVLGLEFYVGEKRGFSEDQNEWDDGKNKFLPLPWHDLARKTDTPPVQFSRFWLQQQRLVLDNLRVAVPDRSSFSHPEDRHSLVVIDTKSPRQGHGALWCYKLGQVVATGRFTWSEHIIAIDTSDPSGRIDTYDRNGVNGFQVLGKVVWVGYFPK